MDGTTKDGLNDAIVNVARLMRHDGIRLAISTQSPKALPPELLELLTVAVMHRFHSRDWLTYLEQKLPLRGEAAWNALIDLQPGQALVFASQQAVKHQPNERAKKLKPGVFGRNVYPMRIRPRITADRGRSRRNLTNNNK